MRLSVLDQSIAVAGRPHGQSIRNTVSLARHCEALGYDRFWVSEHHNHPTIVGTAPEIVMAAIAATTERIRIGSAGIMLPHYSAFKVAEVFRVLDALAPGRIDMGLGRAPGSDGRTAFALNPAANERPEHFPSDVRDLMAWVQNEPLVTGHPFAAVQAFPQGETSPEVWILGSSDYGAQVAAHFGLPYCFAAFITDGEGAAEAMALYRDNYKPSFRHLRPHGAVCIWAVAGETEEAAERLFSSRAMSRLARDRGLVVALPSPEEAARHPFTASERAHVDRLKERGIWGTAAQVGATLRTLAAELQVDEIAILTTVHDPTARRRSYTLLAEEFSLQAAPEMAGALAPLRFIASA